jgi:hypothetical protein
VNRKWKRSWRHVKNSDYVTIATTRTAIEARALVSRRLRPLRVGSGRVVHQVAMPFHWGGNGPIKGDSANDLLAISGEPNVTIMETKALTCAIMPERLPRGPQYLEFMKRIAPSTPQPNLHPEQSPPGGKFTPNTDNTENPNDRRRTPFNQPKTALWGCT